MQSSIGNNMHGLCLLGKCTYIIAVYSDQCEVGSQGNHTVYILSNDRSPYALYMTLLITTLTCDSQCSGGRTSSSCIVHTTHVVSSVCMLLLSNCFTFHCVFLSSVYIELNSTVLPNNSFVTLPEIGTTEATSLRCVTARTDCCSGAIDENTTEWFDPRGEEVDGISTFIRSRDGEGGPLGYVQLRRSSSSATLSTADEGIYSCIIPEPGSDTNPDIITFYVGIYNTGNGENL